MLDLAHIERLLTDALAAVREARADIGSASVPIRTEPEPAASIDTQVAERVRVGGLYTDAEGCLTCEKTAQALGRTPSGLRWHCANGSGPEQRRARRGHRHKLADAIEWEKRQTAAATAADAEGAGAYTERQDISEG